MAQSVPSNFPPVITDSRILAQNHGRAMGQKVHGGQLFSWRTCQNSHLGTIVGLFGLLTCHTVRLV